jgi:hypothetical protein
VVPWDSTIAIMSGVLHMVSLNLGMIIGNAGVDPDKR